MQQYTRLSYNAQCARCRALPPGYNPQASYDSLAEQPQEQAMDSYYSIPRHATPPYIPTFPSYQTQHSLPSHYAYQVGYNVLPGNSVANVQHSPGPALYPEHSASVSLSPSPVPAYYNEPTLPSQDPVRVAARASAPTGRHTCSHCGSILNRPADLARHKLTVHGIQTQADGREIRVSEGESRIHFCTVSTCERTAGGDRGGFSRKDHLTQHLRQVHGKHIEKTRGRDRAKGSGGGGEGGGTSGRRAGRGAGSSSAAGG